MMSDPAAQSRRDHDPASLGVNFARWAVKALGKDKYRLWDWPPFWGCLLPSVYDEPFSVIIPPGNLATTTEVRMNAPSGNF